MGAVRSKTYQADTAAEATRKFEVDATEAANFGWLPSSQTWEGTTLTVVYQKTEPAGAVQTTAEPLPNDVARAYLGEHLPAEKALFQEADKPEPKAPRQQPAPPSERVDAMAPDELARIITLAVMSARARDGSDVWPMVRSVCALAGAGLLAVAGVMLVSIHSVSGDSIAEVSYHALGVMCFGFAALALVVAAREMD